MRFQSRHATQNRLMFGARMFRQTLVLLTFQLLIFSFSAVTANNILLPATDKTVPLSSKMVAKFLIQYFGSHIHTREVKHISLVTQLNSDRRPMYDNHISHLLYSIQIEFGYRFFNNLQWQLESIGASVVIFLIADYMEWQ